MRLAVRHATTYRFDQPVVYSLQRLRLTPKETQGQSIISWRLRYSGAAEELSYEDSNCNLVTLVAVEEGAQEVVIACEGEVNTRDEAGVIGRHTGHLPLWSFLRQTPLTQPGPEMSKLAEAVRGHAGKPITMLHKLSAKVLERAAYTKGATNSRTTAEEAFAAGHGVCQDHAHILIGIARLLELPARYVSGYLMMNDRVEQEATHAWAEVFVEGLGWTGFEVSNGISPDARYVRVATGLDYRDAAPILGISYGGMAQETKVQVSVAQQQEVQQQ